MNLRFEFGENWRDFLKVIDARRIQAACNALTAMLETESLQGLTFLDAGAGSGLSSLAAMKLGAEMVHSFDYDKVSVESIRAIKDKFYPQAERWIVEQGDVLDEKYMASLGAFDIVYSWGALHHTGDMWRALETILLPVRTPKGRLFIGIYEDLGRHSKFWLQVKKTYVRLPKVLRPPYVGLFAIRLQGPTMLRNMLSGKAPWRHWGDRKDQRGMSVWHDIKDWVGGYPFEFARTDEIFAFYRKRGYRLDALNSAGAVNEFVFMKEV